MVNIMKMVKKMFMLFGGMGVLGYMYLKKHPEMIESMREFGMEASKMMYNKLDSD